MSIFSGGSRSVISKRSSTPSSILKKKGNLKIQFTNLKPTAPKVRFEFPHSGRVCKIIQDFVETKISKDFENLICMVRDAELSDDDVLSLMKEVIDCIPVLNEEFCIFIEALCAIKWNNRNETVVREYQTFLVNLVCAHNYHARFVINKMVALLLPGEKCEKNRDLRLSFGFLQMLTIPRGRMDFPATRTKLFARTCIRCWMCC